MSIGEVASAVARVVAIVLAAGMAATDVGAQTPAQPAEPRISLYGMVPGDPAGVGSEAAIQQVRPAAVDGEHKARRGEFIFAPMPMVNPTLDYAWGRDSTALYVGVAEAF